ncbi:MAG: hypothetical protein A2096_13655 [Spirochaetes bacterium GWF1_41_5]|nr:MAG: hypothetical protein A2096_13655 [Spirochaetes bacterium GWF1_41_5]HBE02777.1 hypothetical protein [Spirochaetia bacterium]
MKLIIKAVFACIVCNILCRNLVFAQEQKKLEIDYKESYIPLWMSVRQHLSDDEWRHIANRYSLVVVSFESKGNKVNKENERIKWIKSLNPNVRLLVFLSALSLANTGLDPKGEPTDHLDWFLKNEVGEWQRTSIFGNRVFNPGNTEVQNFLGQKAKDYIDKYGYDGLWLDLVDITPRWINYVSLNHKYKVVNPKTGKAYTDDEWKQGNMELLRVVRSYIGDKCFIINDSDGKNYFAGYNDFLIYTDGMMNESLTGQFSKSLTAFKNEDEWKADIDAMVDCVKRKKIVLTVGSVKKPSVGESMEEYNNLYRYIMASFLLGKGKDCYLWIYAEVPKSIETWTWIRNVEEFLPNYWDMPSLGEAKGEYYKAEGVYQRDFEKGKVLVNPARQQVKIVLEGEWHTEKGEQVQLPLAIDSHSGEILLRQ